MVFNYHDTTAVLFVTVMSEIVFVSFDLNVMHAISEILQFILSHKVLSNSSHGLSCVWSTCPITCQLEATGWFCICTYMYQSCSLGEKDAMPHPIILRPRSSRAKTVSPHLPSFSLLNSGQQGHFGWNGCLKPLHSTLLVWLALKGSPAEWTDGDGRGLGSNKNRPCLCDCMLLVPPPMVSTDRMQTHK